MRKFTFVYPYYENSEMFKIQQRTWASYPEEIRNNLQVIVTDDCSPNNHIAKSILTGTGVNISVYRLVRKIRWNWLACKNLGAFKATNPWLLVTDMDHLVSPEMAQILFETLKVNEQTIYVPSRVNYPNLELYKPHPNSYVMTRKMYWQVGGYDEDYSGHYGTDGLYRGRCKQNATVKVLGQDQFYLIQYNREEVSDASTSDLKRKEGRDPDAIRKVRAWKEEMKRDKVCVHQVPWELIWQAPK